MIDFPATPTVNQVFVAPNNVTYVWDGSCWTGMLNPISITPRAWEKIGDYPLVAATQQIVPDLAAFKLLRFQINAIPVATAYLGFQFSLDNGATWKNGAADYSVQSMIQRSTVAGGSSTSFGTAVICASCDAGLRIGVDGVIHGFNQAGRALVSAKGGWWATANLQIGQYYTDSAFAGPCNALRLMNNPGTTMNGNFLLEGVRG